MAGKLRSIIYKLNKLIKSFPDVIQGSYLIVNISLGTPASRVESYPSFKINMLIIGHDNGEAQKIIYRSS
jgi:hypothetical protein